MMVNVSRFVDIQTSVRSFISVYEKRLREAVQANYAMPDDVADKNEYMRALKGIYLEDFFFLWISVAENKGSAI